MPDTQGKIITIRVPEAVHREAKSRLPGGPETFQGLLLGWLTEWVGGSKAAPVVIPSQKHSVNTRWHELLDVVLADPAERLGIEKNLQWAAAAVRSKHAPDGKHPVKGKRASGS